MHELHSHTHSNTVIGYVEGVVSIIINILLFCLKIWVGMATSSVAIIADAWHTISDSLTSLLVIIGFRISSIPPDKQHPFGHGRAEIIVSLVIGTLLGAIGLHFLFNSIQRLIHHQSAMYNTMAVIVCVVSIVLKEAMARFSFWAGKKIDSQSLIADAWHHRSDAITSVIIIIGIYLDPYFWWIDSIMGIIVSLFICYTTYLIMKRSVSSLIGDEPDEQFMSNLHALVHTATSGDIQLHHVHMHNYGGHKELTFHVILPKDMMLIDAHRISDSIEEKVRRKLNIEATIHIEPLI